MQPTSDFQQGVKDSLPIVAGYFSVSFTFGIMAASYGISPWMAGLISITNVTSAGQFAGLQLMVTSSTLFEVFLTQLIINLRYALMSLSLSQRLGQKIGTGKRLGIAFANTDEIFAVAVSRPEPPTPRYMLGLEIGPVLSWTAGTVLGAIANNLLPLSIQSALGVALYGMFIAIVLPPARNDKKIAIVAVIALILSCILYYVPLFSWISSGFSIIICTVVAAGIGAIFLPVKEHEKKEAANG